MQNGDFLTKLANGVRVSSASGLNQAGLYCAHIVFNENRIFVLIKIVFDVVVDAKVLQLLVRDFLGNLLQQQNNFLLLLQEVLIS